MTIETERLILRPWRDPDAEELYKHAKDPEVGPAAGWPPHISVKNSREIIRNVLSATGTFAVVDKASGCAVGSIGLMVGASSSIGLPDTEAELGYWIGKAYWGRGLIPEAAQAILRYAFEDLGLSKVWCGYYEGNSKSKRVQEKCGFQYQYSKGNVQCTLLDEIRTEHITCLSKEDWLRR